MSHLKNLRIADLELFITAAHLKSLGKAAALHHFSQSAASAAIQRVEFAFGSALCTHEKRQFKLTKEGEQLLPRAENWVRHLHETVAKQAPQPLRIVTTHAIARVCIQPLLAIETFELKLMRPDKAYASILQNEADLALVLDNAPWKQVNAIEVGKGSFQLYSRKKKRGHTAVILPEDQIEVLTLQQHYQETYNKPLPIKIRLPSWSLIADICSCTSDVGFLPDFLGKLLKLHPVPWQPTPAPYRLLALSRHTDVLFQKRLEPILAAWKELF